MRIFYSTLCSIFILADGTFAIGKIYQLETFVQKILDSNELRNIENGVSAEKISNALSTKEETSKFNNALESIEKCDAEFEWNFCTYIIRSALRRHFWENIIAKEANKSSTIEADVADKLIRYVRVLAIVFNIFGAESFKRISQREMELLLEELLSSFGAEHELEETVWKMNSLVSMGGHRLLNNFVDAITLKNCQNVSLTEVNRKIELVKRILRHSLLRFFYGNDLNKQSEKSLTLFNAVESITAIEVEIVFTELNRNYGTASNERSVCL